MLHRIDVGKEPWAPYLTNHALHVAHMSVLLTAKKKKKDLINLHYTLYMGSETWPCANHNNTVQSMFLYVMLAHMGSTRVQR